MAIVTKQLQRAIAPIICATMSVLPIQVTDAGVLIPRAYLREARAFVFVLNGDYVLVKPADSEGQEPAQKLPGKHHRFAFIAAGQTRNPDASTQVEEILLREGLGTANYLSSRPRPKTLAVRLNS